MSTFTMKKTKEVAPFYPENRDKCFLRNRSVYVTKCMTSNPRSQVTVTVEVTDCSQKLCSSFSDEIVKTSENVSNFGPLTASMNTNSTKHLQVTN